MKIVIIGAGYVGLVTGAGLAELGHTVICIDQDSDRISQLNRGEAPFFEPGLDGMLAAVKSNLSFMESSHLAEAMDSSEASFIAVGTPAGPNGVDLGYVEAAAADIGRNLERAAPYHVVVCKSTVVPGTVEGLIKPTVAGASKHGLDSFGVASNPEFLREGCAVKDVRNPDRIVIGTSDDKAQKIMEAVYAKCDCPILAVPTETAEMIKYTSNALMATMISFSNEISDICESIGGVDAETVMDGLHLDRRLSPITEGGRVTPGILSYLRPGCGYGGSCLPKDLAAIRAFAGKRNVDAPFLDSVVDVNRRRAVRMVDHAERLAGGLEGKTVSVLGLSFKPDTDDLRESPALVMISELHARKAHVRAHDPVAIPAFRKTDDGSVETFESARACLEGADAAIIATAWPQFRDLDWTDLVKVMNHPNIVDGRNLLRNVLLPSNAVYQPVGRAL